MNQHTNEAHHCTRVLSACEHDLRIYTVSIRGTVTLGGGGAREDAITVLMSESPTAMSDEFVATTAHHRSASAYSASASVGAGSGGAAAPAAAPLMPSTLSSSSNMSP